MLERLFVLCLSFAPMACGEGVQPDPSEVVYFTALETDDPKPEPIPDPGPRVSSAQSSDYEPIVNGFVRNHEQLLRRPDIATQIERIDNVFLALGRYHELAAIYRDEWERAGPDSHVADRWAWALIRLGQRKQAREVIDELLRADPNDARHHFLDGAYWIQVSDRTTEDLKKAVSAWKRVLELDPNFRGYENINAQVIESEVAKFEEQVGPTDPAADTKASISAAVDLVSRARDAAPTEIPERVPAVEETPEPSTEPDSAEAETEAEAEEPAAKPERRSTEKRYRLAVARGEIALSQGKYQKAEEAFLRAKALRPDGFDAQFGQLQAGWGNVAARNDVAAGMRELAKRDDLTPKQKLDLGIFLWTKMARKDLATQLLEAARKADPSLADRADGILDAVK